MPIRFQNKFLVSLPLIIGGLVLIFLLMPVRAEAGWHCDWWTCPSGNAQCKSNPGYYSYTCSGTSKGTQYTYRYCKSSGYGSYCGYCHYDPSYSDCGGNYWSGSYTCSGTMQQRLYYSRGCSSGSCYNNSSWQNYQECGGDYWSGSYRCSGTMQQRLYYSRGCSSGSCYNNSSWQNNQECGGNYWSGSYSCSGNMKIGWYVSRGCSGTACYNNGSWQNYQDCGGTYSQWQCSGNLSQYRNVSRCSGGTCGDYPTGWFTNQDCGGNYWTDSYRCSGTMQQRLYVHRGCSSNSCYNWTSWENWSECGGNYWSGSYSCSGNMKIGWYVSRGCSGTACYNNGSWQNYQDCGGTYSQWQCSGNLSQYRNVSRCSGGTCGDYPTGWFTSKDCGGSGWTNNYQCSGNVLQRQYISQGCSGSGSCYGPTYPWYEWENCATSGKICSSNQCIVPPDTTPPSFSYFYVSPTGWTNGNPTWSWSATDSGSGMRSTNRYYIFLDGAGQGYTMATSYTPSLGNSSHYVSVNAYDANGNARGSGNVYAYVDKTNPSSSLSVNKTSVVPGETITLTISASDSHSGINVVQAHYQGSWHNQSCGGATSCTRSWSFTESSYGSYTYTGNTYDQVGNAAYTSPSTVTVSVVDNTPPSFTSFYVSPTGWTNGNPTWSWSATDSGSGMRSTNRYYIFLDGAGQGYTMSTSYQPSLGNSSHYVSINAYDAAGNAVGSGNIYGYVDKTAPTVSLSVSPTGWTSSNPTWSWTASDAGGSGLISTYYIYLDNVAKGTTTAVTYSPSLGDGSHKFEVCAYDNTSNWGCDIEYAYVDKTAPSISLSVSPTGWTDSNPIWSWTASDSSSGLRNTNRYYIFLDGAGQGYTMSTSYQPSLSTGSHRVSINAYDNTGNAIGSGDVWGYVDKTNPSASLSTNKTTVAINEVFNITITGSDGNSGLNSLQLYYNGSWHSELCGTSNPCTKIWNLSINTIGTYTFSGYVFDKADNGDSTSPSGVNITVTDALPPIVSVSGAPSVWQNADATASVACNDGANGSGCDSGHYYLNIFTSNPGSCSGYNYFFKRSSVTLDSHSWICAKASDNAGNAGYSGAVEFRIDQNEPNTPTINSPASGSTQTANFSVSVSGDSDSESGIQTCYYHIEDSIAGWTKSWATRTCNSSFTVTVGLGKDCRSDCKVYVFSRDNAGNLVDPAVTRTFHTNWDQTPPTVSVSGAPSVWQNTDATASIGCSDAGLGCDTNSYYLNIFTSNPGSCSGYNYFFKRSSVTLDSHSWICGKASDNADNVGYSGAVEFKIDQILPDTPTIASPASGSNQPANFSVSVSGDLDNPSGSGIDKCYYHVQDSVAGWTKSWAERTCNSSFIVTVGPGKDCRTNNGICTVYVFSKDKAGNDGDYRARDFKAWTCSGNVSISLNKDKIVFGETVTATISNLIGCTGSEIEIMTDLPGGGLLTKIGECVSGASGCVTNFLVSGYQGSSTLTTYPIWARVDKNKDSDFLDVGEESTRVDLQVVNSAMGCYSASGCSYLAFKLLPSGFDHWTGMIGGSPGQVSSSIFGLTLHYFNAACSSGGISCQVAGSPSASNGASCYLADACTISGFLPDTRVYVYPQAGKWDSSQNQCAVCRPGTFIQDKKIMDTNQKCLDVGDGNACLNPPIWTHLACENIADNNKCESACGAPSNCDERAINAPWTEGSNQYKCDADCEKVLIDNIPPVTVIKETNPAGGNWFNQNFSVRIEDTDDQGLKNCWYNLYSCNKGGITGCSQKKTNFTRTCNSWTSISSADCNKEGVNTCKIEAWAVDNSNNIGTKVSKWYSMDFTGPSVTK